jgi:hypothetical protein
VVYTSRIVAMRQHLTKHKKKYGFAAALGLAGISVTTLVQPPVVTAPKADTPPTISQRQEAATQRLEADRERCNEWISQEKRQEAFGADFATVGGQYHASTGTQSLSCTFREGSTSFLVTKRTIEDQARADKLFESSLQPTSSIESVAVGEKGFWSTVQKNLITRRGNEIYTLRASPATSSEIIVSVGEKLFGKSE